MLLKHNKLLKVLCDNEDNEKIVKSNEEYEFTFGGLLEEMKSIFLKMEILPKEDLCGMVLTS